MSLPALAFDQRFSILGNIRFPIRALRVRPSRASQPSLAESLVVLQRSVTPWAHSGHSLGPAFSRREPIEQVTQLSTIFVRTQTQLNWIFLSMA